MSVTTATVTSLEELRSLSADWDRLAARFKTPLLRFDWFHAAAVSFCPPGQLAVFVQRTHDEVSAIAPLIINVKYGFPRYEFLGTSLLREPCGLLYRDRASLLALVDRVSQLRKPVCLDGLSCDAEEVELLKDASGYHPKYSAVRSFASPWIPIRTSWEQYYASMSSSWRSSLRRSEKRAKEFGAVTYEIVTPGLENVDSLTHEVFQVENSGWKSRIGTAMQANGSLGTFFSAYARSAALSGKLRIAFLRIGGKAVAVQLLVEEASRFWVLKIGYDEAYARCSPGILLMQFVIKESFGRGLEAFELLGTNQHWLNIWPNELHHYQDFFLRRFAPSAIITHGIEVSDRALGKLRTTLAKSRKLSPPHTFAEA